MFLQNAFFNAVAITMLVFGILCYGVILMFDLMFVRSNSLLVQNRN